MSVTYSTRDLGKATLIEFDIENGVLEPSKLAGAIAAAPDVDGSKGVIISGRGPIWLFGGLIHQYHATAWVATFDPRVCEGGGGVVVDRHSKDAPSVGTIIPVPKSA